jgi:hypothetical protein
MVGQSCGSGPVGALVAQRWSQQLRLYRVVGAGAGVVDVLVGAGLGDGADRCPVTRPGSREAGPIPGLDFASFSPVRYRRYLMVNLPRGHVPSQRHAGKNSV